MFYLFGCITIKIEIWDLFLCTRVLICRSRSLKEVLINFICIFNIVFSYFKDVLINRVDFEVCFLDKIFQILRKFYENTKQSGWGNL